MSNSIKIKFLFWDHPDATILRQAQQLEIDALRPRGLGITATAANVPVFIVAYKDDIPIACGGLRPLSNEDQQDEAEIKRMYVVPSLRGAHGRGDGGSVAQMILQTLEQAAREREWSTLKVATARAMLQAKRFYEKSGYLECPVFGAYKGSEAMIYFEKVLLDR